jgi:Spy/CpxP family protein refolding chaperone
MLSRLFTVMTLLLLALALPATAAPYGKRPGWADYRQDNHRQHLKQLRAELDLTPEQAQQIHTIISERREQVAPLRARCRTDRTELQQAFRDRAYDKTELQRLAYRQADQRIDLLTMRRATHDRISALLTPEQRNRWEQLRDRSPGRGGHHGQERQSNF